MPKFDIDYFNKKVEIVKGDPYSGSMKSEFFKYLSSSQCSGPAAVPAATLITSCVPSSLLTSSTSLIQTRIADKLKPTQEVVCFKIHWNAWLHRCSLRRRSSHLANS